MKHIVESYQCSLRTIKQDLAHYETIAESKSKSVEKEFENLIQERNHTPDLEM